MLKTFQIYFYVVPVPNHINTITLDNQTVGQSLTLECSITTVRGITSRVDIVWSSNGIELKRTEGTNVSNIQDNIAIYTDSYDISQLNTSDEGRVYQCKMFVNVNPLVMANGSITLDLTGKMCIFCMVRISVDYLYLILYCSSYTFCYNVAIWPHTRRYGR